MNPEFRRNLWLELTSQRLILTPVMLMLLFMLIKSASKDHWVIAFEETSKIIFLLVSVIWGARLAFDSVVDEVQQNTWEWQRMSAQSAWSLTWGKLFGATILTWLIGAIAALVFLLVSPTALSLTLLSTFSLLLAGVLSQATGLLFALVNLRGGRKVKSSMSTLLLALAFILAIYVYKLLNQIGFVSWYGMQISHAVMMFVSLCILTSWAVIGCYRFMQEALQVRAAPWASLMFAVCMTVYITGFYVDMSDETSIWVALGSMGAGFTTVLAYHGAWSERRDIIAVRRFVQTWSAKKTQPALEATPYWLPLTVYALLCGLVATTGIVPEGFERILPDFYHYPMIGVLLMVRDIGILYYLSLGRNPQSAGSTTIVYLLMLYLLIPTLLKLAGLGVLAQIVCPIFPGDSTIGIAAAVGHCVFIAMLFKQRLHDL